MKKICILLWICFALLVFTNCDRREEFNVGNKLLYWGYYEDYNDKLAPYAYYGFVGGDRFECKYDNSRSLKILEIKMFKNDMYVLSKDTFPSLGVSKCVLRKNGKVIYDDMPGGTLYINNKEIRAYSKNLSLAPNDNYKSYYWKDGEYNYLNLEEPAADVAIYYPVITDIQQVDGDFYYMGFCPSANGIVAAGWKNEKLLFNSRDTVKPAGVLPKGMIVDNQDCYWLFVKGRYTVLYKNNEIIHYFGEEELMDVDPSLSYVPLGIYKDGDDFYYAIVRSSNTVSQISNKSIMIYKGYEELFRITGLTQCVQVKDGTVYTLINRGNNAVFYENENAIYSFSIEKNRCHNFILYEE